MGTCKNCCGRALADGIRYVWIDSCCMDKRSSAELSEALNSMFKWYEGATICYLRSSRRRSFKIRP
ncbi:hypothetical protein F4780DRAFT_761317 [Xylariomycetidae sp. FL0641]|nr:hypothetical protein F4780DRAFT_761317 [Xylariomycetidae sp. FL0641]